MGKLIATTADLETAIGRAPAAIHLKVIDHLDPHALNWIAHSPLLFAAFGDGQAIATTIGGGPPGFARATSDALRLALDMLDDPDIARPGAGFGSLFLVPGIGETLRVNGRVTETRDGQAVIRVEECYLHCAKAFIRSDFWKAQRPADEPDEAGAFIAQARFTALATIDPDGHADLSPKGDPAGAMARLDPDGMLRIPDRPGNRRADSFRNIMAQPGIAATFLIPGSSLVAVMRGVARLNADPAICRDFAVQGKAPSLVLEVAAQAVTLRRSGALERATLWPSPPAPRDINPASIFVAHMKLNKDKGLGARLASAVVSVPGLMQKGLAQDYKKNLY